MKQHKTIKEIQDILPKVKGLQAGLLYGSFGRNNANPNSDIDIQILVDNDFEYDDLIAILKQKFKKIIQYITKVELRNMIVMYLISQPKVEFQICEKLEDINRNYLNSEITNIENSILYASSDFRVQITEYLQEIQRKYGFTKTQNKNIARINVLINRFLYEFENSSNMHSRSDAYRFYFFYNIALHLAIQLKQLSLGKTKHNYLPRYFAPKILTDDERPAFYELKGTLYLPEANQQKRKLLNFFYASIKNLVNTEKKEEVKQFLEWVFERDYFWNFRDISTYNTKIKSGLIYRSATMSAIQNDRQFTELLNKKNIKTIIDLRADSEIDKLPYKPNILSNLDYVKSQFDPWSQPEWYKKDYYYGTNSEIIYRFVVIACQEEIKKTIEAVINENNGAVVIHCTTGRVRTGILFTLFHLLVETPLEAIYTDYMSSEIDVETHRLDIVINLINEKGGIVPYLISCGLREKQIEQLKNKLLK